MSKGPTQTGTQTTTTTDPRATYQAPYLQSGWESANDIWRNETLNPAGYNAQYSVGSNEIPAAATAAAGPYNAAVTGQYSGANSPAYSGYQDVSTGNTYGQEIGSSAATQGYGLAGQAAPAGQKYADLLSGTATDTKTAIADPLAQSAKASSGYYLNSNPYLTGMYNSAADATTSAYQTATAPRTDSSYELAGRYGSGALSNAQTQDKQVLGKTLANEASDIYGKDYASERGLQTTATSDYGKLALGGVGAEQTGYNYAGNQALSGIDTGQRGYYNSGNLGLSGTTSQLSGLAGLQTGYDTGNKTALSGTALLPTMQAGYAYGPGLQQSSISGLQAQQWDPLQQYTKIITQPSGYTASTSTAPIYGSSTGQTLGSVGSLLGGIGSLAALSDRRLKEDTRVVGHVGRLPLHTFRYKGEPPGTKRIGFMADEVARVDPGAVRTTNLGFAAVDYGRAAASALRE